MSERGGEPGSDPVGDFQRWLMRAGARGLGRDVADKVRGTFSGGRGDVWDTATSEPVGESPECQWCPICRAARRFRDSGPGGIGNHLADVGDTLAGFAAEAASIIDTAVRAGAPGTRTADRRDDPGGDSHDGAVVGSAGVPGRPVAHPHDQRDEAADEGGHREERGEAGDGPAEDQRDDQVGGPAEQG